jgi:lambda family phage portal protein
MAFLDLFKKASAPPKKRILFPNHSRMYSSAKTSEIFSGFNGTSATADQEIFGSLQMMRNRSRQVCQDNELARKFLAMVKSNVVLNGINFQAKTRREDGSLDELDNQRLERGWKIWGENPGFCSMDSRSNFTDISRQIIEACARDGECFIRMMKGVDDNPFGFSLWVLEADYFPIQNNKVLSDEVAIVMSVEQDKYGKPLAYHQLIKRPGLDYGNTILKTLKTERVPADEIIHLYVQERPGQTRGVPWLNTAIRPLDMLAQYQLSELTSSRVQSSSMGFFTSEASDSYVGTGVDEEQNIVTEFEPGTFQQLPEGMSFQPFNPGHPNQAYKDFTKTVLRSVASGLLVSYNSLSNDLESVNYSSIRAGQAEEKAQWMMMQNFFIHGFCSKVYKSWLRMAITVGWFEFDGQANLPMSKVTKFEDVRWIPRGWEYVNPKQELEAKALAVQLGVESLTDITANRGKEWDEVISQLAREKDIINDLGLKFETPPITPGAPEEDE